MKRVVALMIVVACTPTAGYAESDPSTCAAMLENASRLTCYDSIFRVSQTQGTSVLEACEAALKQSLKAPATYQRANVIDSGESLSLDAFKDIELIRIRDGFDADTAVVKRMELNKRIDEMRATGVQPVIFRKLIEYEAQNSFGALIRGRAVCSFVSGDGTESTASSSSVFLSPNP